MAVSIPIIGLKHPCGQVERRDGPGLRSAGQDGMVLPKSISRGAATAGGSNGLLRRYLPVQNHNLLARRYRFNRSALDAFARENANATSDWKSVYDVAQHLIVWFVADAAPYLGPETLGASTLQIEVNVPNGVARGVG